jgi:exonuclease VII small subunit
VIVAAIAAIMYVAVSLSKLESGQNSMNEKLDGLKEGLAEMKEGLAEVKDAVREMSNVLAGVQRQGRSLARGIREAAPCVTAFACASPDEVEAWLVRIGYEEYAHGMKRLGGSGVLLLTEASLAAMGVAPKDCSPLLDEIIKLR